MASGNTLRDWSAINSQGKVVNQAYKDIRNNHFMNRFDAGVDTEIILDGIVPDRYGATTGFTVNLCYGIDSPVVTGNVVWAASLERMQASTASNVHNADNFGTEVAAAANAVPAAAAQCKYLTIAITKAQANNLVAGERFRLKVRRTGTAATDTCKGAALLLAVELRET